MLRSSAREDHPITAPRTLAVLVSAGLAVGALLAPDPPPRKKLLQWGWDEPDTAYLRAHLPEMETSPFDGCMFGVRYGPGGKGGSFTWQAWGRRAFTREDLADAFADLRALRPERFTELFLRVNVTPGDVGWFQDFEPVLANLRLAAELARAGRARGVLLDVEQYQGPLFDFRRQPLASAYGWDANAAQVRLRGRQAMTALQQGYPGLTVFLTFGHSLPWVQMTAADSPGAASKPTPLGTLPPLPVGARRPLSDVPYGLLAPFIDGLLEGARGRTVVIDGFELSYGFKEPSQFAAARRLVQEEVLPIVGPRDAYRRRLRLAFGLWLDYDWRRLGWHPDEPQRNYFTPEAFARAVQTALMSTDTFVWVYSERTRQWRPGSPLQAVPAAYSVQRQHRGGWLCR
jgi:hypothetical protein